MERWTHIYLWQKNQPPITIILAYQVCKNPTNRIGNTAYHQQQRLLSQEGRTSMHPRQAFIHNLTLFINRLRAQRHNIILGGDFNEALTDKKSLIFKLATSTNLVDPFGIRHPQYHSDTFGTHVNGNQQIDLVLITPPLLNSSYQIGNAPFEYTTTSDHCPLFMDFESHLLFRITVDLLSNVDSRQLRSNNKNAFHWTIRY